MYIGQKFDIYWIILRNWFAIMPSLLGAIIHFCTAMPSRVFDILFDGIIFISSF